MEELSSIDALRKQVLAWRKAGLRVGFVPTMGNLHGGHLTLVDEARRQADRIVVSIFVNPTQFSAGEDFSDYPRTYEADCALLKTKAVDLVFAPSVEALYPDGPSLQTRVDVPRLNDMLCGLSRPGHFTGVATVVAKLFNIVQPDLAVFGLKDYQQLMVIRQMTHDLAWPIEIVGAPIAREPSGLAMSSRNAYLSAEQTEQAAVIYQTLTALADRMSQGEAHLAPLVQAGLSQLTAAGLKPDYLEIRRAADLEKAQPGDQSLVILVAAHLGRARLIDNLPVMLPAPGVEEA
ncbi:MAG: pantoate--beta-alanine ligase [Gammaproteobacteria bacterium]|nr:pantoate--beta-alanine ligase [Gammaproteobacteria bacterium]